MLRNFIEKTIIYHIPLGKINACGRIPTDITDYFIDSSLLFFHGCVQSEETKDIDVYIYKRNNAVLMAKKQKAAEAAGSRTHWIRLSGDNYFCHYGSQLTYYLTRKNS
jgi:hypothetical protein